MGCELQLNKGVIYKSKIKTSENLKNKSLVIPSWSYLDLEISIKLKPALLILNAYMK